MTQGRKSRTGLAIGIAMLVALAALAAAFPVSAVADEPAAGDEYNLDLPDSDGGSQGSAIAPGDPGGDDSNDSGAAPATPTERPTADPATESTVPDSSSTPDRTEATGNGNDERGDETASSAGSGNRPDELAEQGPGSTSVAQPEASTTLSATPSDDGGAPVLLIVLAVLAAICTALAIWRLRRGDRDDGSKPDPSSPTTGATESQST